MTTTRRFPRSARLAATAACLVALAGAAPAPKPFVPVLRENFPDAFIMQHGGLFYAYATNADRDAANLQMATSTDLVNWTLLRDPRNRRKLHDAMPTLAPWARKGFTWAPEVVAAGGKFVVYFTARESRSDLQCLGAAVSADPRGPFLSDAAEPLVCQRELGGTIDAHPFRDADGQLYLYYKNDGNNPKVLKTAQIWAQRLSPDGLKLVGEPGSLVAADKHWEWRVVEAPTMVRHAKGYTLFFSANHYGWEADQRLSNYGVGYADCAGPMGPCVDAPGNPLLSSRMGASGCISGPGHQSIFQVGERSFMSYHAWDANAGCRKLDNRRFLYISPLVWNNGKPEVRMSIRPVARK
ncbi:MAG TPA: glycoside hydrolase family 43 protein [Sphingomonadaceae bacterium]|nr:glycoside hydrolase family 43 protein [Sphingomonadaceae bacterium]